MRVGTGSSALGGWGMGAKALGMASAALLLLALAAMPFSETAKGTTAVTPAAENGKPAGFDQADLERRLTAKGVALGTSVMIRIFKVESQLEVWLENGKRYELFATYDICNWSGMLGPKQIEGDRQSPEGFYSVGADQLHRRGRWRRSLDIGYPNTFDRAHGRTGSFILVHGGCATIGCFAMTNPVMDEIYALGEAALAKGQERIHVHVFPFRMTKANLDAHANSPWSAFWANLKPGYDAFERTHNPPQVNVCANQYVFDQSAPDPNLCVTNVSEASVAPPRPVFTRYVRYARLARRGRGRVVYLGAGRSRAGRNVRRAYAAARVARVAAYRRHALHLGGPRRARR
jgi:murein L,D-transpeptidase YafK